MCITKFALAPATMSALLIIILCTLYATRTTLIARAEQQSRATDLQSRQIQALLASIQENSKEQRSRASVLQLQTTESRLSKKIQALTVCIKDQRLNTDPKSIEPRRKKNDSESRVTGLKQTQSAPDSGKENPQTRPRNRFKESTSRAKAPKNPQKRPRKPRRTQMDRRLPQHITVSHWRRWQLTGIVRVEYANPNHRRNPQRIEDELGPKMHEWQMNPKKNKKRTLSKQNASDADSDIKYSVTVKLKELPRKNIQRLYSQICKGIRQLLKPMNAETPQDIFIKKHPTISQTFTLQLRKECYKSSIKKLHGKLMHIADVETRICIIKGTYRGRTTAVTNTNRKVRSTKKLQVTESQCDTKGVRTYAEAVKKPKPKPNLLNKSSKVNNPNARVLQSRKHRVMQSRKIASRTPTNQQGLKDVVGSKVMVKTLKNDTAMQGGINVDAKPATADSKVMPIAQATDGTITNTRKDSSLKEGSALKNNLRKVGVIISSDLSHPEDIVQLLTEKNNTLLDSLKHQLRGHRLRCTLVDFLSQTRAHILLVEFLKKLGVELKIVGTETSMQQDCECGHISAQVIQLLANHGADWWSIPKDKFAGCASDKSIAEVNKFLTRKASDRNRTSGDEVLRFAKSRIKPNIDTQAIGYLAWYKDMDKPLTQALITILEDLHGCLNNNSPFARTMLINTDWLGSDKGFHWMTLRLASQPSNVTVLTTNPNTQEVAITISQDPNRDPLLGKDARDMEREVNSGTKEVTKEHAPDKRMDLSCIKHVKRDRTESNKRPRGG